MSRIPMAIASTLVVLAALGVAHLVVFRGSSAQVEAAPPAAFVGGAAGVKPVAYAESAPETRKAEPQWRRLRERYGAARTAIESQAHGRTFITEECEEKLGIAGFHTAHVSICQHVDDAADCGAASAAGMGVDCCSECPCESDDQGFWIAQAGPLTLKVFRGLNIQIECCEDCESCPAALANGSKRRCVSEEAKTIDDFAATDEYPLGRIVAEFGSWFHFDEPTECPMCQKAVTCPACKVCEKECPAGVAKQSQPSAYGFVTESCPMVKQSQPKVTVRQSPGAGWTVKSYRTGAYPATGYAAESCPSAKQSQPATYSTANGPYGRAAADNCPGAECEKECPAGVAKKSQPAGGYTPNARSYDEGPSGRTVADNCPGAEVDAHPMQYYSPKAENSDRELADQIGQIEEVRRERKNSIFQGTQLQGSDENEANDFNEALRLVAGYTEGDSVPPPPPGTVPPGYRAVPGPYEPGFAAPEEAPAPPGAPDPLLVDVLRHGSRLLDLRSHDLEDIGRYQEADHLRALAQAIRHEARKAGPSGSEGGCGLFCPATAVRPMCAPTVERTATRPGPIVKEGPVRTNP